jgi:hypothetical protein
LTQAATSEGDLPAKLSLQATGMRDQSSPVVPAHAARPHAHQRHPKSRRAEALLSLVPAVREPSCAWSWRFSLGVLTEVQDVSFGPAFDDVWPVPQRDARAIPPVLPHQFT